MIVPALTVEVRTRWRDRGGSKGYTTLRFPFSTPPATVFSRTSTIIAAMEAISDAVVDEIKLYYRGYENTPATPAIGSEVAQFVGLYYSNEGEFDAVFIPAPKPSLYETVGPYAGIRVDTSNPTVLALLESLNLALATAGASVSFPLGSGFMAGGRVL